MHWLPPFPIVWKAFDPLNPPDLPPSASLGLHSLILYFENLSVISDHAAAKHSLKTPAASHPAAVQPAPTLPSKSAATSWAAVTAKHPTASPSLVPSSLKMALQGSLP